jgi:Flp pilus assembly protein TadG
VVKAAGKQKRTRVRRVLKRMRLRRRKGSAAIEFAMLAPVLFVLIMGIIEVGLLFFSQFMLEKAVTDAGRLIRTGQAAVWNTAAPKGMTQTQFHDYICGKISSLLSCGSNLQIDIEAFSTFATVSYTSPLNANKTLNTDLKNYNIGDVCNVVLVRVFYTWNVATPLLTPFMTNMANNQHLLSAAAAFRNEPYNTSVAGC